MWFTFDSRFLFFVWLSFYSLPYSNHKLISSFCSHQGLHFIIKSIEGMLLDDHENWVVEDFCVHALVDVPVFHPAFHKLASVCDELHASPFVWNCTQEIIVQASVPGVFQSLKGFVVKEFGLVRYILMSDYILHNLKQFRVKCLNL